MLSSRVVVRAVQCNGLRAVGSIPYPGAAFDSKIQKNVEHSSGDHATKAKFDKDRIEHRKEGAGLEGDVPTKFQKRLLVLTQVYKNQSEIPETVQHDTMYRMQERIRGVLFITFILGFGSAFTFWTFMTRNRVYHAQEKELVTVKKN